MKNNNLSDTEENSFEIKDNLTGQLIPIHIEDTLNEMIQIYLSKNGFGVCSLSYLIANMATNKKINFTKKIVDEDGKYQQIIILKFLDTSETCSYRDEVLQFANMKHLTPTFSFYAGCEDFYIGYVLNHFVTDESLIQNIVNKLLEVFADYNVDISYKDLDKQFISFEYDIQHLIISDTIYIPVKGDVSYGD